MKLIDKAIFGMVSESPGRNESELTGDPDTKQPRRLSPLTPGESSMAHRNLADAVDHFDGAVEAAR